MDFNFSKIKHLKQSDDMIFNLLLKYRVNNNNSLEIVKDYLKKNAFGETSQGIRITEVYTSDIAEKVLDILEEKKEYIKKTVEVIDKSLFNRILIEKKYNISSVHQTIEKLIKKEEITYLTPYGIVRLKEKDCEEISQS